MARDHTIGVPGAMPKLDEPALAAFLKTQPDVMVAYLFGSLAQRRAKPGSDVDIAILLADALDVLAWPIGACSC